MLAFRAAAGTSADVVVKTDTSSYRALALGRIDATIAQARSWRTGDVRSRLVALHDDGFRAQRHHIRGSIPLTHRRRHGPKPSSSICTGPSVASRSSRSR